MPVRGSFLLEKENAGDIHQPAGVGEQPMGDIYTVLRTHKHQSMGGLYAAIAHCLRERETTNADPTLYHKNINFTHKLDAKGTPQERIKAMLDDTYKTKDSVYCIEYIMSASPEWWENATAEEQSNWYHSSLKFLHDRHGVENVQLAVAHRDETTPHISAFVVPREKKRQNSKKDKRVYDYHLNAKKWLGGRKLMSDMQDDYAKRVAHLGIQRGIKGSAAEHQKVKKWYASQNKNFDAMNKVSYADLLRLSWKEKLEDTQVQLATARTENETLKFENAGLKHGNARQFARTERAEARADALKEQLDAIRSTELKIVAEMLGMSQGEDSYWRHPHKDVKVSLDGQKFYDYKASKGRAGAFDFIMQMEDLTFAEAKQWALDRFGNEQFKELAKAHIARTEPEILEKAAGEFLAQTRVEGKLEGVKPYKPIEPDDSKWGAVARHLSHIRAIPMKWLEAMHQDGVLYADKSANYVWKTDKGAQRVGTGKTPFKGWAAGSKRNWAWRFSTGNAETKRSNLVICENPLDGIAYMIRNKIRGTICATFGIANAMPENVQAGAWERIIVAYDNDKAGKEGALRLAEDCENRGFKNTFIHTPNGYKDWNEALQNVTRKNKPPQGDPLPRRQFKR